MVNGSSGVTAGRDDDDDDNDDDDGQSDGGGLPVKVFSKETF